MPLSSLWRACSRHFWYPRRAANAPTIALTHHTTIAAYANAGVTYLQLGLVGSLEDKVATVEAMRAMVDG